MHNFGKICTEESMKSEAKTESTVVSFKNVCHLIKGDYSAALQQRKNPLRSSQRRGSNVFVQS